MKIGLKTMYHYNSGPFQRVFKILHDERGREADKSYINGFSKKKFIYTYWTILVQKISYPHNSGLAVRTFLHNERGLGVHGSYVNGFPKTAYPQ